MATGLPTDLALTVYRVEREHIYNQSCLEVNKITRGVSPGLMTFRNMDQRYDLYRNKVFHLKMSSDWLARTRNIINYIRYEDNKHVWRGRASLIQNVSINLPVRFAVK